MGFVVVACGVDECWKKLVHGRKDDIVAIEDDFAEKRFGGEREREN